MMRSIQITSLQPAFSGGMMLRQAWVRACAMVRARATRRLLLEMDSRLLADIGIGRGDALAEAGRPFWSIGAQHGRDSGEVR